MKKKDRDVLRNSVRQQNKWTRRAIVLARVLRSLGYSTIDVMEADGEELNSLIGKEPKEVIDDYQMRVGGGMFSL